MHFNKVSFAILATSLTAASLGQIGLRNSADAYAYNPAHDHQEDNYTFAEWVATGTDSLVSATSESHPWDPPVNIATAKSEFIQQFRHDATVRGMSFVLSDYSGSGTGGGYRASTNFELGQKLGVTFGTQPFVSFHLYLIVPMHGLMSVRTNQSGGTRSMASAALYASASGNGHSADTLGIVDLVADQTNGVTYQTGGDWDMNDVTPTNVDLPTGNEPRSWSGFEVNTNALLDLGVLTVSDPNIFDVYYSFTTSVEIESPNSSFALSDFSGTGDFDFVAFDADGSQITDFTMYPVLDSVPEPTSMLAIGLGLAALARRRRPKA